MKITEVVCHECSKREQVEADGSNPYGWYVVNGKFDLCNARCLLAYAQQRLRLLEKQEHETRLGKCEKLRGMTMFCSGLHLPHPKTAGCNKWKPLPKKAGEVR